MTKKIKKGERIYPTNTLAPAAIATANFKPGDVGEFDDSIMYPVDYHYKLLLLPGLKKKYFSKGMSIKKKQTKEEKKCRKHKRIE